MIGKVTLPERLCNLACTKVVKFLTDQALPANVGFNKMPYTSVSGYRYINI